MSLRAAVVFLIAACARPLPVQPAATDLGPTLGSTHVCGSTPATSLVMMARQPPPPAAQRLLAVANELELAPPDLVQAQLVHALHTLADTLEVLVPGSPASILRVRASAEALEHASARRGIRADVVRMALDAATRALYELELAQVSDRVRFREAIDSMAVATSMIDPARPLQDQFSNIRIAFREVVRAVFFAVGAGEPELLPPSTTAIR